MTMYSRSIRKDTYPVSDRRRKSQRGFTLVLFASAAATMIGFTGLAVDVGYAMHQKRYMQAAADAGALAAAHEIANGNTTTYATAAKNDTALNGFTDGVNNTVVSVTRGPSAGNYSGNNNYVEVTIYQPQNAWFMQFFGVTSIPTKVRSVAGTPSSTVTGCIFLTDPSFQYGLYLDGNSKLTANCSILDNDSSDFDNQGNVTVTNGGIIGVQTGASHGSTGTMSPSPTIVSAVGDPLNLTAPSKTGLTTRSTSQLVVNGTGNVINPGIYNGGIFVSQDASVTLNPGLYYLQDGGIDLEQNSTISGTGVTIYMTGNINQTAVLSNSISTINLKAPTSNGTGTQAGSIEGVVLFLNKSASVSSSWGLNIQSNGQTTLEGIVYFPGHPILWESGSTNSIGAYTIIVTPYMRLDGTGTTLKVAADYSSLAHGNPITNTGVTSGSGGAVSLAE